MECESSSILMKDRHTIIFNKDGCLHLRQLKKSAKHIKMEDRTMLEKILNIICGEFPVT